MASEGRAGADQFQQAVRVEFGALGYCALNRTKPKDGFWLRPSLIRLSATFPRERAKYANPHQTQRPKIFQPQDTDISHCCHKGRLRGPQPVESLVEFQINALSMTSFRPLFALSDVELSVRNIRRVVADGRPYTLAGSACRMPLKESNCFFCRMRTTSSIRLIALLAPSTCVKRHRKRCPRLGKSPNCCADACCYCAHTTGAA